MSQISHLAWAPIKQTDGLLEIHSTTGRLRWSARSSFLLPANIHLYLVRHGETHANQMQIFQGSDYETEWTQLSEKGHMQSRAAGELLVQKIKKERPLCSIKVISSPAERAKQTAAYFLKCNPSFSLQFEIFDCLNEIKFGDMTGKTLEQICALSPQHDRFIYEYRRQGNAQISAGGSESFVDVLTRVYAGLKTWLPTLKVSQEPQVCVMFTHMITAGAVRTLLGDQTLLEQDAQTGPFIRWRQVLANAEPHVWDLAKRIFKKVVAE